MRQFITLIEKSTESFGYHFSFWENIIKAQVIKIIRYNMESRLNKFIEACTLMNKERKKNTQQKKLHNVEFFLL